MGILLKAQLATVKKLQNKQIVIRNVDLAAMLQIWSPVNAFHKAYIDERLFPNKQTLLSPKPAVEFKKRNINYLQVSCCLISISLSAILQVFHAYSSFPLLPKFAERGLNIFKAFVLSLTYICLNHLLTGMSELKSIRILQNRKMDRGQPQQDKVLEVRGAVVFDERSFLSSFQPRILTELFFYLNITKQKKGSQWIHLF